MGVNLELPNGEQLWRVGDLGTRNRNREKERGGKVIDNQYLDYAVQVLGKYK